MTEDQINQFVENFIRSRLSPQLAERTYITKKYDELSAFLSNSCFQSGSYARFTAIHPVHDLDIIWITTDSTITSQPRKILERLANYLAERYKEMPAEQRPQISIESHSITLLFSDGSNVFSIDVVPAIPQVQRNEYGDPLYIVPEVQKMGHRRRQEYYASSSQPPTWILSDPKGYITAASRLDSATSGRFRKTAKLIKAWRHKCKEIHKDQLKLKAFHLEMIVTEFLTERPGSSVIEACIGVVDCIPLRLQSPHYRDRADSKNFIDEYVQYLSSEQKNLILRLQAEAQSLVSQISTVASEQELENLLEALVAKKTSTLVTSPPTFTSTARQPWAL